MRNMFRAAVIGIALACAAPVAAGPFEDGYAAVQRGDYATAMRLWRPLAEQGNVTAQNNLGIMYDLGQGVPQDHAEAVRWFRKAAEQGDAFAQYNLGRRYNLGQGVPQDHAEAVRWFRKAAEQGDVGGQFNLGNMYYFGQGVPQDYVEAHKWWNLAAAQGAAPATEFRDRVAKEMTPAQIAEAQKLAREWRPKTQ